MKPKFAQGYLDSRGKLHPTYEEAEKENRIREFYQWWYNWKANNDLDYYSPNLEELMLLHKKLNELMGPE